MLKYFILEKANLIRPEINNRAFYFLIRIKVQLCENKENNCLKKTIKYKIEID